MTKKEKTPKITKEKYPENKKREEQILPFSILRTNYALP